MLVLNQAVLFTYNMVHKKSTTNLRIRLKQTGELGNYGQNETRTMSNEQTALILCCVRHSEMTHRCGFYCLRVTRGRRGDAQMDVDRMLSGACVYKCTERRTCMKNHFRFVPGWQTATVRLHSITHTHGQTHKYILIRKVWSVWSAGGGERQPWKGCARANFQHLSAATIEMCTDATKIKLEAIPPASCCFRTDQKTDEGQTVWSFPGLLRKMIKDKGLL